MDKTIVTGANGFVGFWLIRELVKQGVKVTAVIKDKDENISMFEGLDNIEFIFCDLYDLSSLLQKIEHRGFDAFYHLAWISAGGEGRANYKVQLDNVKFACDALCVSKMLECKKILYSGTITENLATQVLTQERKAQNNIYGICKHMAHCLVDIESAKHAMPYVWMQFSNLFGPYSVNGNIVSYTIKELLLGHNAEFGPANQPYDLLYIEDLAHAAYLLGEKETHNSFYYIGSGNVMMLSEYLLEIGRILQKENHIKIGVRPDDGTRYDYKWFDIENLVEETGYRSISKFEEGIRKTADWIKSTI